MAGGTQRRAWNESGTASVASVRPMLAFARTLGVNTDAILRDIGVPPDCVDDCDERIPETSRARAWIAAAAQSGDPAFGLHAAAHSQVGAYDVLDYSLYYSSTLGEALDRICRFHRVLCDAWAVKRDVTAGVARVRRVERTPAPEAECYFAWLVLRARAMTGRDLPAKEVRFAHAAPADPTPHAALFRAPVRFGAAASELLVPAASLALPVETANPGLDRVLDRYMTELLAHVPKDDTFVERVRAAVAKAIDGSRPSLATTARALHASPRTVQRRLGDHGTTYVEVVDAVRREVAERMVAEGRVSLTEIAFLLGFADLSGFRRMYKRWTGVAPSRGRSRG